MPAKHLLAANDVTLCGELLQLPSALKYDASRTYPSHGYTFVTEMLGDSRMKAVPQPFSGTTDCFEQLAHCAEQLDMKMQTFGVQRTVSKYLVVEDDKH